MTYYYQSQDISNLITKQVKQLHMTLRPEEYPCFDVIYLFDRIKLEESDNKNQLIWQHIPKMRPINPLYHLTFW